MNELPIEKQAATTAQLIEDSAAQGLKKLNPKLFDLIETAITRDKLTPAKIDRYVHYRFGLKKGHPVRDMCYLAAMSLQRKMRATTPPAPAAHAAEAESENTR